jgi:transcription initiation factor TFIIIB Brf1 subunit/transcription initiation factor TFIIB
MDDDPHDADACKICGSSEGIEDYWLDGEVVLRCERHTVGINLTAEEIYWRRRSSSDEE